MTPYGHAGMQYPQPLQMSSCTTTVSNSVRKSAPVGQTSRQAACVQCLQTSDDMSQRNSSVCYRSARAASPPDSVRDGRPVRGSEGLVGTFPAASGGSAEP